MQVAGVDGCRGGWVVVTTDVDGGPSVVERVVGLVALVAKVRAGELRAVAIDMPIGLPSQARRTSDAQPDAHRDDAPPARP